MVVGRPVNGRVVPTGRPWVIRVVLLELPTTLRGGTVDGRVVRGVAVRGAARVGAERVPGLAPARDGVVRGAAEGLRPGDADGLRLGDADGLRLGDDGLRLGERVPGFAFGAEVDGRDGADDGRVGVGLGLLVEDGLEDGRVDGVARGFDDDDGREPLGRDPLGRGRDPLVRLPLRSRTPNSTAGASSAGAAAAGSAREASSNRWNMGSPRRGPRGP